MADLRVNFCGVELKNPITTASGTFGFGHEYGEFFDLSMLGGIGVKGLTPTERLGNPAPRIAETPQGILNCVGLQNPGIDRFIKEQIPFLRQYDTKIIANVSGNTVEEYEGMVEKISDADVDLIEMNISCPNVKCGGMAFGTQPKMVEEVVSAAKAKAKKPLIVKLSPNVTDIAEIARAAESAGADALSLINTLLGMRIDISASRSCPTSWAACPARRCSRSRSAWSIRSAARSPCPSSAWAASAPAATSWKCCSRARTRSPWAP